MWQAWADALGIPRLTFMAAYGAGIERGGALSDIFDVLDIPDWRAWLPVIDEAYGAFRPDDLYPDVLRAMAALKRDGWQIAVIGNQPARRTAELRALGVVPDVMAMSAEMGVAKPDGAFFARALELMGDPPPGEVAYVGDRIDNDVLPSSAAGMRGVWLRRGPWGVIPAAAPPEAALVVGSLDELVRRLPEAWPDRREAGAGAPADIA